MPSLEPAVMTRLLLGVLLLSWTLPSFAVDPHRPGPFTAVFALTVGGVSVGRMTRALEFSDNDGYRFSSVVDGEGLVALLKPTHITEESVGHWSDTYPVTERYSYEKRAGKKYQKTVIDFDWAAGRSRAVVRGTPIEANIEAGDVDKLSYQLALMRDLATGSAELRYRLADAGRSKDYHLERRAAERITIASGTYETVPVAYLRDDGRRTVLWCASELQYIPVRIEYREKDGGVTRAELVTLDTP